MHVSSNLVGNKIMQQTIRKGMVAISFITKFNLFSQIRFHFFGINLEYGWHIISFLSYFIFISLLNRALVGSNE